MTSRNENATLYQVANDWGLGFFDKKEFDAQEYLLHELCHAKSLGFALRAGCDARTSLHFDRVNAYSVMLAMAHEAHCFAIQRHAIRLLRWQKKIDLDDVVAWVWRNGYSGQPCSLPDFRKLIALFEKQDQTRAAAFDVVKKILRLARRKKKVQR